MKFFFTILAVLAVAHGTSAQCPPNFPEPNGASCYSFQGDDALEPLLNFEDARLACIARGGMLAEITTAAENTFLQNFIDVITLGGGETMWWQGFDARTAPPLFRLTSSGGISPLNMLPAVTTGECAQLEKSVVPWNDGDCADVRPYICELSLATVTCDAPTNDITFSIDTDLLTDFLVMSEGDLHIGNNDAASCALNLTGNTYSTTIAPGECGTTLSYDVVNPQFVNFMNTLVHEPSVDGITRSRGVLLAFTCKAEALDVLSSPAINPAALQAQLTQVGFGDFDVELAFTDNAYANPDSVSALSVTLGDPVYVQLSVSSAIESQLDIYVDRCFASPSSSFGVQGNIITLIEEDCPGDILAEATLGVSADNNVFNFEFNAFEFVVGGASQPNVYVHCETNLCLESVVTSLCATSGPCARRRRREVELVSRWKRQTAVALVPGTTPERQRVSLGPINVARDQQVQAAGAMQAAAPTFYGILLSMGLLYLAV